MEKEISTTPTETFERLRRLSLVSLKLRQRYGNHPTAIEVRKAIRERIIKILIEHQIQEEIGTPN